MKEKKEKLCLTQDPLEEGKVLTLPCDRLVDHPLRLEYYQQSHLAALTASIQTNGLLEPIWVQPLEDGHYQILNGHYRVRAVRRLRQKTILCHLFLCDPRTALVLFCTSNLLTKSLSPLEEALMMKGLMQQAGFSLAEVGELWGHGKSWVSRRLKLLTGLDPQVKRELSEGRLKPRLAQELARLPQGNDQSRVLALVKRYSLTKDQTAELIDWWQKATKDERSQLENKDGPTGVLPAILTPLTSVYRDQGQYAQELLQHSTSNVDALTVFLGAQQPPFGWWPYRDYQSFRKAVQVLADLAPTRL